MRRLAMFACTFFAVAAGATLTSGCADDIYGRGGLTWSSHPYYGWYDNYYGPFYDGYWGTDGYFWFRLHEGEGRFRRDESRHFRRENSSGSDRFHRFEGTMQPPRDGARMPRFPQQSRRRPN